MQSSLEYMSYVAAAQLGDSATAQRTMTKRHQKERQKMYVSYFPYIPGFCRIYTARESRGNARKYRAK